MTLEQRILASRGALLLFSGLPLRVVFSETQLRQG
jgi:hypothetical protein